MIRSGIYLLTFPSGNRYIGKSVDVDLRMAQHAKNFMGGSASAKMQAEYARSGMPTMSVIQICHPEHLDVLEPYYMTTMHPELNSVNLTYADWRLLNSLSDETLKSLQLSTAEMLHSLEVKDDQINNLKEIVSSLEFDLENKIAELDSELETSKNDYYELEDRLLAIEKEFGVPVGYEPLEDIEKRELRNRVELLEKIQQIHLRKIDYLEKPWYKRLFKKAP